MSKASLLARKLAIVEYMIKHVSVVSSDINAFIYAWANQKL